MGHGSQEHIKLILRLDDERVALAKKMEEWSIQSVKTEKLIKNLINEIQQNPSENFTKIAEIIMNASKYNSKNTKIFTTALRLDFENLKIKVDNLINLYEENQAPTAAYVLGMQISDTRDKIDEYYSFKEMGKDIDSSLQKLQKLYNENVNKSYIPTK